jgi:hypothetical protein
MIGLLLGTLMGALSSAALRHSARLYGAGGPPWQAAALHIGQFLAAAAGFVLLARWGAAPLLAAVAGFTLARAGALLLWGRAA